MNFYWILLSIVLPTYLVQKTLGVCGGDFTGTIGEFSSPNYPNFYENDQTCNYKITVSSSYQIMLKFNYFETGSQRDYVHVYNGDTAVEEELIDSFSGTTSKPPVVFSSGNTLLLVFQSDSSTVEVGFYATYSTIPNGNTIGQCGGTYTSSTGVITSPLYPLDHGDNQDCAYAISTSTGNVIELEFLSFDTEYNNDFVKVYDGSVVQGISLGEFSGDTLPAVVTSTGSSMYVQFTSDSFRDEYGFSAIYRAVSKDSSQTNGVYSACSDDMVIALSGTIQSHSSYPDGYPANTECTVYIRSVGSYDSIYLTFKEIDLYNGCSGSDKIVVTDGYGIEVANLCSSGDTNSYETTTGQFKITFTTGSQSGTNKGFQAVFNQYYEKYYSCNSDSTDFHCDNDWCIPESLECDGTKHCSDHTDESCSSSSSIDTTTIIIVIVVIFILLLVCLPTIAAIVGAVKKSSAKSSSTAPKPTPSTARQAKPADGVAVSATPAYMQRPIGEVGGSYDPAYPTSYGPEKPYDPTYPTLGEGDNPPGLPAEYGGNTTTTRHT